MLIILINYTLIASISSTQVNPSENSWSGLSDRCCARWAQVQDLVWEVIPSQTHVRGLLQLPSFSSLPVSPCSCLCTASHLGGCLVLQCLILPWLFLHENHDFSRNYILKLLLGRESLTSHLRYMNCIFLNDLYMKLWYWYYLLVCDVYSHYYVMELMLIGHFE